MVKEDRSLGSLREEEVVEYIARRLVSPPSIGEHLGYPDDARDLLPRGPRIIVSTDAYSIESLMLPWRTLRDVGWSSVIGALSDVVSKGGIPHACMIALGVPRSWNLTSLGELVDGIKEATSSYGVKVLGGDTNSSLEPWIAITVIGFTSAKIPPRRAGLGVGDIIIVTGRYGAMGYVAMHGFERSSQLMWVVKATKRPTVRVEVAYVIQVHYRQISSTMDVSDGLGYTLNHVSRLSGKGIKLEKPPIVHEEIVEICRGDQRCILDYALLGGEEYGVVMGVKREHAKEVTRELEYYNIEYAVVGEVIDVEPGVYYEGEKLAIKRYDQFGGWTTI